MRISLNWIQLLPDAVVQIFGPLGIARGVPKQLEYFSFSKVQGFPHGMTRAVERVNSQDSLGCFHYLRRSAVRNMTNAGLDQKIDTAISGHKTDSVFRPYRIVARRNLH